MVQRGGSVLSDRFPGSLGGWMRQRSRRVTSDVRQCDAKTESPKSPSWNRQDTALAKLSSERQRLSPRVRDRLEAAERPCHGCPPARRQCVAEGDLDHTAFLIETTRFCAVAGAAVGGHSRSDTRRAHLSIAMRCRCGKGPALRPCPLHSRAYRAAYASRRLCPSVRRRRLTGNRTCTRA